MILLCRERSPPPGEELTEVNSETERFDFSGLYHWCPTRSLEEVTVVSEQEMGEKRICALRVEFLPLFMYAYLLSAYDIAIVCNILS